MRLKATRRGYFENAAERLADAGRLHLDLEVGSFDTSIVVHGSADGAGEGWVEARGNTWGSGVQVEWETREELIEILANDLMGSAANFPGVGERIPLDPMDPDSVGSRGEPSGSRFRNLFDEADALSRAGLDPSEVVLEVGRCADITTFGDLDTAGASWVYVMVTDTSLRWLPLGSPETPAVLALDAVESPVDARWRQRCALVLRHEELIRTHLSADHDWVTGPLKLVVLAFSHAHTKAADALRAQLEARSMHVEILDLPSSGLPK
ncbi:MAG: hypothetical protein WD004_06415 [Actinomycetota bacterium]